MSNDNVFEGLDEATKARIEKAGRQGMLAEIEKIKTEAEGKPTSPQPTENPAADLTPEELQHYNAGVKNVVVSIHEKREAARIAPLKTQYFAELKANRGQPWKLGGIREKYRAMGVPVDQIGYEEIMRG